MTKNILICDANHGGLTLLDEYSQYTSNNLFFYDIYNKLSDDEKEYYSNRYDVTFLDKEDIDDSEYINENYTTIAPVHMKPVIDKDYTHHEFTEYLVNKHRKRYLWDFKIIQVTGVKAKTTITSMIRDILNDYNILLLNSNELSYNSNKKKVILDDTLSITPASIITALNIAQKNNLLDKIDYFIVEVSLGVIPNESIGVLTNILEDYPIADNTLTASAAKKGVFSCDKAICLKESYDKYYNDVNKDVIKISLHDRKSFLYATRLDLKINDSSFGLHYNNREYDIKCFALTDFYVLNILFAVGVGLSCGMSIDEAKEKINDIKSIDGRTSYKKIGEKIVIEEINPGLNTSSIKKSIDNIRKLDKNFNIILGGDYGITCEEIDEIELVNYIMSSDRQITVTGELGKNLKKQLPKDNITYIYDLNAAIENCIKNSKSTVTVVIYRSEYAKKIKLNLDTVSDF
ncbi:MAG: coenzyme F430 synthase [Methanosphaera sp.]|nr:coenzyme F430 synthase [Methanosphaera sp.]